MSNQVVVLMRAIKRYTDALPPTSHDAPFIYTHRVGLINAILEELGPQMVSDVEDFHAKFGINYDGKPRALPNDLLKFRLNFMIEELQEYQTHVDILHSILSQESLPLGVNEGGVVLGQIDEADVTHHLEEALDALVDLTYVVIGTAHYHGFNFKEAWRRVHAKNMEKIRPTSSEQSTRGATFDVVKPPGWEPPSHTDLVEDHIHRQATPPDAGAPPPSKG